MRRWVFGLLPKTSPAVPLLAGGGSETRRDTEYGRHMLSLLPFFLKIVVRMWNIRSCKFFRVYLYVEGSQNNSSVHDRVIKGVIVCKRRRHLSGQ
jgi:hypothetical protein